MFCPPRHLGGYFKLALLVFFASLTVGLGATFTIQMNDSFQFVPINQTVSVGDTVTWTNTGTTIPHTSTSGTNKIPSGLWDSGNITGGKTFSFTFNGAPGDYAYYCTPHVQFFHMQGKITVTPANLPPSVSVTNPVGGASFASGTPIAIQADASDADGTVTRVDFFANGQPLGSSFSPPYGVLVSSLVPGNYALTAVATDNTGANGNSSVVNISVFRGIIPPTVSITNPASGKFFIEGENVLVEASAADADGVITEVKFFTNGVPAGQAATPPYSLTLSNLALGDYVLTALATDNDGATSGSPAVIFSVIEPPEAPVVAEIHDQTVFVGSDVTFVADAAGTPPLFYQWQFYGTNLPAQTATNLTLLNVSTNNAGPYSVVVSNSVGSTSSVPAILTVLPRTNIPPVVTLTNPPANASFPLKGTVSVAAHAFDPDPDGAVTQVEFFVRTGTSTNSLGIATNPPYRVTFVPTNTGTYFVSAVATDDQQGVGRSGEVSFEVLTAVTLIRDPDKTNLQAGTTIKLTAALIATNITFGTVTKVEFFDGAVKLGAAVSEPYTFLWKPTQIGLHFVSAVATDDLGQTGASTEQRVRIFAPDAVLPKVAITNPPRNFTRVTNSETPVITLAGVASDNIGLDRVEYQINDADPVPAEGMESWKFSVPLQGGQNTVRVRSIDLAGNPSSDAVRFYTYEVRDRLTLTIEGGGHVTPALDGELLFVGKTYQVTARPAPGQVFAGWEGRGNEKVLNFRMETNLNLVATFQSNLFAERAGKYTGLYLNTNGPSYDDSGSFTLQLAKQGAFSGKLTTGAGAFAFHGRFDVSGVALAPVIRPGLPPLLLGLRLDTNGPPTPTQLTGWATNMVGGEPYVAELVADKNVFSQSANRAPHVGQHLFSLASGNAEGAITGTVLATVYGNGQVRFRGLMEPGGIFSVVSALSPEARSPIYVRFDQPRAVMLGWLGFGDAVVSGDLLWLSDQTNRPPITLQAIAPQ